MYNHKIFSCLEYYHIINENFLHYRRPVPNAPPQIPKRPAVPGGKPDLSTYYANPPDTDGSLL